MERYIMGIWFEITAFALLLSISINLQTMYLLMKKKNENSGSWKLLMTKTFTLVFLLAWALMIVGYLLGMLDVQQTMVPVNLLFG